MLNLNTTPMPYRLPEGAQGAFDIEPKTPEALASYRAEAESLGLQFWWSDLKKVYVIGRKEPGRMRKVVQVWDDGFYTPGTATRPAQNWEDHQLADAARFLGII